MSEIPRVGDPLPGPVGTYIPSGELSGDSLTVTVQFNPPLFVSDVVIRGPDGDVWHEIKDAEFRITGEDEITIKDTECQTRK
jgi:hypothetical protein